MRWNDHWRLEGRHAYLSASKHHWLEYDDVKLKKSYDNHRKAQEGTELHELAKILIKKRIKLRGTHTLAAYVNDAIGFKMDPEVVLVYQPDASVNPVFWGTADAIKYDPRNRVLRIHDLKTGTHPGNMRQLKIYAVLFFLEYGALLRIKPHDIAIEMRIYQNDEIVREIADPDEIVKYMNKGKHSAKLVAEWEEVAA
jgi:hypothetical protein